MYCILYALFGVPLNAILVGSLASLFTEQMTKFKNKMWQNVDGNNNDTAAERKHTLKRVFFEAAGFFLVFFMIFMPITAVIFSVLEGDDLGLTFAEGEWSFLNSLYFTFITFSTIGFGDMVPGVPLTFLPKTVQLKSILSPIESLCSEIRACLLLMLLTATYFRS